MINYAVCLGLGHYSSITQLIANTGTSTLRTKCWSILRPLVEYDWHWHLPLLHPDCLLPPFTVLREELRADLLESLVSDAERRVVDLTAAVLSGGGHSGVSSVQQQKVSQLIIP